MSEQYAMRLVVTRCPQCDADLGLPAGLRLTYNTGRAITSVTTRRELTGHPTDLPRARPVFRGRVTRLACAVCDADLEPVVQRFKHTEQFSGPMFEEEPELNPELDLQPEPDDDPDDASDADWRQDITDIDGDEADWTRELPFLFALDEDDDEFYDA